MPGAAAATAFNMALKLLESTHEFIKKFPVRMLRKRHSKEFSTALVNLIYNIYRQVVKTPSSNLSIPYLSALGRANFPKQRRLEFPVYGLLERIEQHTGSL